MTASVDNVRSIALDLPATTEKLCWGTPAWYVKGKIFARILEDGVSVVVKVDFDERTALVQEDPKVYAVTSALRALSDGHRAPRQGHQGRSRGAPRRGVAVLGTGEAASGVRRENLTAGRRSSTASDDDEL